MNSLHFIIYGIIMCTVLVGARHHGDHRQIEQDDYSINSDDTENKHNHAKDRHRKKRFQPYHSYHYAVPQTPFYYPDRREDSTDLSRIIRLLEDIAHHVRQPLLPSPQIVYIPIVPYGVPQNCNCPNTSADTAVPTFDNRIKPTIEENQNWGFVEKTVGKDDSSDDDFSRPISLTPAQRPNHFNRPQPKESSFEEEALDPLDIGGDCVGPLLSCCLERSKQKQLKCLTINNCQEVFYEGTACQKENIIKMLNEVTKQISQKRN